MQYLKTSYSQVFTSALAGLLLTTTLFAQIKAVPPSQDVCCFGVRGGDGSGLSTFAQPLTAGACKVGTKDDSGGTFCGSTTPDACSSMTPKDICTKCGYFWNDAGICSAKELVPKDEAKAK